MSDKQALNCHYRTHKSLKDILIKHPQYIREIARIRRERLIQIAPYLRS